jgi:hypothetical protein
MPPQLLLKPEAREEVDCRVAEEVLHALNFEEFHIIDEEFERDL